MKHKCYKSLDSFVSLNSLDMHSADLYNFGSSSIAVYTSSAPGNNSNNEDHVSIYPLERNKIVLAVADGAGGHSNGAEASAFAISKLSQAIGNIDMHRGGELGAIMTGIDNANKSILNELSGSASTIAVVEIQDNIVRTYHVGDTEVLIVGRKGKIKHQTLNHSPVGYAVEAGLLSEESAALHEERHLVSNLLGFENMHIAVSGPTRMDKYDSLIIATDGLFDNLHKTEVIEAIRKGNLDQCCDTLIQLAKERMQGMDEGKPSKSDDMSFIIFRLN